jgi:hypothetical protein
MPRPALPSEATPEWTGSRVRRIIQRTISPPRALVNFAIGPDRQLLLSGYRDRTKFAGRAVSDTLNDLKTAWRAVTPLEFEIESHETEPSPDRRKRRDDDTGVSSIAVKMLRNKFDQQWLLRKSQSRLWLDSPLRATLSVMDLKEEDVLALDFSVGRLLDLTIHGEHKFVGRIVTAGNKRGFQIEETVKR